MVCAVIFRNNQIKKGRGCLLWQGCLIGTTRYMLLLLLLDYKQQTRNYIENILASENLLQLVIILRYQKWNTSLVLLCNVNS